MSWRENKMLLALLFVVTAQADPLQSALAAAHRDYMAQLTDKFAETTADPRVIGRAFKFERSLTDGDSYSGGVGGAYYTYKDGKLVLNFSVDEEYAGPGLAEGPQYTVGTLGGKRTTERSYVGSNAYGATRRVEVVRLDQDGIAMLDRPEGAVDPYAASLRADEPTNVAGFMPPLPKNSYLLELPLPGHEAREVAVDAALVVEGTIAPLEDGKLSFCKSTYSGPEIDAPTEIYGSKCWVGAKVRRIAFVRKSTGQVLKEWVK